MKTITLQPLLTSVKAEITIPGSKSYTNRSLCIAAITSGKTTLTGVLKSDDTTAMISCLKTLGIPIQEKGNTIIIQGGIHHVENTKHVLDAKLSATTIRFLTALAILLPRETILTGEKGLRKRPIGKLVDALRFLGAHIEYLGKKGFPPVRVTQSVILVSRNEVKTHSESRQDQRDSGQARMTSIKLDGSISSQFLSSILMISPLIKTNVKIVLTKKLISAPYVAMTIATMKQFGVHVKNNQNKTFVTVKNQQYKPITIAIEGDYSSASYFAAVAALTKSTIILKNLNSNSLQADKKFFSILEKMGNTVIASETKQSHQKRLPRKQSSLAMTNKSLITIIGKRVKPVTVDMTDCPDTIQTLAVLAAFSKGVTKISGITSLKIKETNRVAALQKELEKMRIQTQVSNNTLTIFGGNPNSATIETYGDHRMAMAFAVVGSILSGMKIKDPDVVSKTFPQFWREMEKLGIRIRHSGKSKQIRDSGHASQRGERIRMIKRIVLIGFMGAGKSSVAPLLAKKMQLRFAEMDDLIIKKSNRVSVEEIFVKDGEDVFRQLEMAVARNLQKKTDIIVSTGGGVITNEVTMKHLKKNAVMVLLDTSFATVLKRIPDTSTRPLLKNIEKARKMYEIRLPLYKQYADMSVTTDGKSLGMITDEIIKKINI